ncbi:hypothetical protein BD310DRAFT_18117 [Dichomitus squalens]|uniref:Uncharacterized protein n=1 Tax=Dichomitus squalens TaxID=114155 RepID=A0A4Q9QFJ3_9APHY|nr:hypothetical protein BD310DRAFT_18117 [Dichomitus squalens]
MHSFSERSCVDYGVGISCGWFACPPSWSMSDGLTTQPPATLHVLQRAEHSLPACRTTTGFRPCRAVRRSFPAHILPGSSGSLATNYLFWTNVSPPADREL